MFYAEYPNTKTMIRLLTDRYMEDDPELDTARHFDRIYTSPSCIRITDPVPDLDFSQFGWGVSRWIKFCRDYMDPSFLDWAERLTDLPVTAEWGYPFNPGRHDNGGCVVYLSFRSNPVPTFTLYSRASHVVPTSILELSLVNLLVERIRPFYEEVPQIYWMAAQIQFSPLWAFPYMVSTWLPENKENPVLQTNNLAVRGTLNQLRRFKEYKENGTIPAYGRTASMFKRISTTYEPFIPHQVYLNEEWY